LELKLDIISFEISGCNYEFEVLQNNVFSFNLSTFVFTFIFCLMSFVFYLLNIK